MDQEDRTAPPTERRRREAREQGRGPRSQDLSLACRLLGVAAAIQFCGANFVLGLAELLSNAFQRPLVNSLSSESAVAGFMESAATVALNLALFVSWIVASGLLARLAQVGFRLDFAEIAPDWERISPTIGFSKLLRLENVSLSVINVAKFLLLVSIGGWFVWSHLGHLLALSEEDVVDGSRLAGTLLISLAWQLAIAQMAIGAFDYGWQYWKFEQSLTMTPEEVRQER
jgi:flagellar biosynthetic protein FlhB